MFFWSLIAILFNNFSYFFSTPKPNSSQMHYCWTWNSIHYSQSCESSLQITREQSFESRIHKCKEGLQHVNTLYSAASAFSATNVNCGMNKSILCALRLASNGRKAGSNELKRRSGIESGLNVDYIHALSFTSSHQLRVAISKVSLNGRLKKISQSFIGDLWMPFNWTFTLTLNLWFRILFPQGLTTSRLVRAKLWRQLKFSLPLIELLTNEVEGRRKREKFSLNCRNYLWTLRRFRRHQSEKEIENPNCYLFRKFFACRLHSSQHFLKITFNCTLTAEARVVFSTWRTKSSTPTPLALFRCWYVILVFEMELRELVAVKRV